MTRQEMLKAVSKTSYGSAKYSQFHFSGISWWEKAAKPTEKQFQGIFNSRL